MSIIKAVVYNKILEHFMLPSKPSKKCQLLLLLWSPPMLHWTCNRRPNQVISALKWTLQISSYLRNKNVKKNAFFPRESWSKQSLTAKLFVTLSITKTAGRCVCLGFWCCVALFHSSTLFPKGMRGKKANLLHKGAAAPQAPAWEWYKSLLLWK